MLSNSFIVFAQFHTWAPHSPTHQRIMRMWCKIIKRAPLLSPNSTSITFRIGEIYPPLHLRIFDERSDVTTCFNVTQFTAAISITHLCWPVIYFIVDLFAVFKYNVCIAVFHLPNFAKMLYGTLRLRRPLTLNTSFDSWLTSIHWWTPLVVRFAIDLSPSICFHHFSLDYVLSIFN